jgi:hypothetical protein
VNPDVSEREKIDNRIDPNNHPVIIDEVAIIAIAPYFSVGQVCLKKIQIISIASK